MLCLSLMFANSIGYSDTTTKGYFVLPPLSAALRKGFTEGLTSALFIFMFLEAQMVMWNTYKDFCLHTSGIITGES